jgi:hypothetical protein
MIKITTRLATSTPLVLPLVLARNPLGPTLRFRLPVS